MDNRVKTFIREVADGFDGMSYLAPALISNTMHYAKELGVTVDYEEVKLRCEHALLPLSSEVDDA